MLILGHRLKRNHYLRHLLMDLEIQGKANHASTFKYFRSSHVLITSHMANVKSCLNQIKSHAMISHCWNEVYQFKIGSNAKICQRSEKLETVIYHNTVTISTFYSSTFFCLLNTALIHPEMSLTISDFKVLDWLSWFWSNHLFHCLHEIGGGKES
jgi:hypothetical protein